MSTVAMQSRRKYNKYERAISQLRKQLPQLRLYARNMTGNPKLKLVPAAQSQTDGNTIYLRPPTSLGAKQVHTQGMCDLTDSAGTSLCAACATRQFLMVTLQHEIGHCINGSFQELDNFNVTAMIVAWQSMKYILAPFRERMTYAWSDKDTETNQMLKLISSARHPHLSAFCLVAEDVRCNRMMFDQFPEMEVEFQARMDRILEEGIDTEEGLLVYADMPDDRQISMAFLVAGSGGEIEPYFNETITDLMSTADAKFIVKKMLNASDVYDSATAAAMALKYANDNDLCVVDPHADDDEINELFKELMKMLAELIGHAEGGACDTPNGPEGTRPDDDVDEDGNPRPAGHEHGKADADKKKSEEELLKVIESLEILGSIPLNVDAPRIIRKDDIGDELWIADSGYNHYQQYIKSKSDFTLPESVLGSSVTKARIAFGVNRRADVQKNQRSGRVDGRKLARRVPFSDDRMFGKKTEPTKRDYHVVIGLDSSGSTAGETYENIKLAALGMAEVCHRVGVSFEIWGHTTYDRDNNWFSYGPAFYEIKAIDERWTPAVKDKLRTATAVSGNLDGHSMRFYRMQAERAKATEKIIMYYTDGAMPASNFEEELEILKAELMYCKKQHITVMGVGVETDSPTKHGLDTVRVDSTDDLRSVVDHLGKKLQ
jgi:Cobalamin biosynthesis protein CobT VWA domain